MDTVVIMNAHRVNDVPEVDVKMDGPSPGIVLDESREDSRLSCSNEGHPCGQ